MNKNVLRSSLDHRTSPVSLYLHLTHSLWYARCLLSPLLQSAALGMADRLAVGSARGWIDTGVSRVIWLKKEFIQELFTGALDKRPSARLKEYRCFDAHQCHLSIIPVLLLEVYTSPRHLHSQYSTAVPLAPLLICWYSRPPARTLPHACFLRVRVFISVCVCVCVYVQLPVVFVPLCVLS